MHLERRHEEAEDRGSDRWVEEGTCGQGQTQGTALRLTTVCCTAESG